MACTLCVLLAALPAALPVCAALLRAAVALANRVIGRPPADRDYDSTADEYDLPPWRAAAVPVPEFGKALGLVVVIALADAAAGFALGTAGAGAIRGLDPGVRRTVLAAAFLAAAFVVRTGLLALLLPTTLPRAALVALFQLVLSVPLALGAGAAALVALNAAAPNMGR
jgi:hypothetical protein